MRSAANKFDFICCLFGLPIGLLSISVQGFSLVSLRTDPTTRDANRIQWSLAKSATGKSPPQAKPFTRDSSTLTKTQVAAWYLSQQLVFVLKQEEQSWKFDHEGTDDDDVLSMETVVAKSYFRRKKMPQMIRWLNTRLLFGCTALEYVQQAATLEESDMIGEEDRKELKSMLDFSEFDLPYLDDSDEEDDYYRNVEFDETVQEYVTADQSGSQDERQVDDASNSSSPSFATNKDANSRDEAPSNDSPPVHNFGRPLEIVQLDVPPSVQKPMKMTRAIPGLNLTNNMDDMNRQEDANDSVLALDASVMDNKSIDSNGTQLSSASRISGEDQKDVDIGLEISGSGDIDEPVDETLVETVLAGEKYENESLDGGLDQEIVDGARDENSPIEFMSGFQDSGLRDVQENKSFHNKASNTKDQARLYKASALIAHSFETDDFNPPIWTRNGNFQTIGTFLARGKNPALTAFEWDERQRMETPDGDFFVVDWKYSDLDVNVGRPSNEIPLVLLCHGLQSNSDSYLAKDMARAFNSVGMDVACINFRGCSDEINRGRLGYHLGFTDDLKLMVKHVLESRGGSKLYLSGFSLGANVVTKLLAEWGTDALSKYNIRGAAVNALPFDFVKIGPNFSNVGSTKTLYGNGLLKSLQETVLKNFDGQNYTFSKEDLMNCKTLREFDDLVVCDVYGFDGVDDYHRKCSTVSYLDQIAVPQLVVQALDDPFFQGNTNPPNNASRPLRIQYTEHGGHCGYWQNEASGSEATWMPLQLARFLKYVDEQQSSVRGLYDFVPNDLALKGGFPKQDLNVELRQRAAQTSHSFQVRDYRPASYATNAHLQTVMGALYRKETMYASSDLLSSISSIPKFKNKSKSGVFQWDAFHWDRRQRIETPDNDFFDVDWKTSGVDFESDNTPLVIICHGLQASSDSPLVKDMAEAFLNQGMGAACINFRGCGGEANKTPRGYHVGFTEDLQQYVSHVNTIYPNKRIYLSAFSLGANVVTTFLANLGSDASKHNIAGAAVNALPFELSKSAKNLNSDGLTKTLYADRILESMYERVEEMIDNGVEFGFEREKVRECKTIMDMENLVIAPFFDFADAWDYYDKTSTLARLDEVAVPELVIQSEDDPFLLGQSHVKNKPDRPLRIHYTKYGGHCGHVFHSTDQAYPTSWMPTELARFLTHVDLSLNSDDVLTLSSHQNQNMENKILK